MFYFFPEITFADFTGAIFLGISLTILTFVSIEALKRFINDLF